MLITLHRLLNEPHSIYKTVGVMRALKGLAVSCNVLEQFQEYVLLYH